MIINNQQDMKGHLSCHLIDKGGVKKLEWATDNHIVLGGRDMVARLFLGETIPGISHIAVGVGAEEVDANKDQTLDAEIFRKPLREIDLANDLIATAEKGSDGDKVKLTVSTELDFDEANDAITEAALFNHADGGIMYNRVVFPVINKTKDFKLAMVWEILF